MLQNVLKELSRILLLVALLLFFLLHRPGNPDIHLYILRCVASYWDWDYLELETPLNRGTKSHSSSISCRVNECVLVVNEGSRSFFSLLRLTISVAGNHSSFIVWRILCLTRPSGSHVHIMQSRKSEPRSEWFDYHLKNQVNNVNLVQLNYLKYVILYIKK